MKKHIVPDSRNSSNQQKAHIIQNELLRFSANQSLPKDYFTAFFMRLNRDFFHRECFIVKLTTDFKQDKYEQLVYGFYFDIINRL